MNKVLTALLGLTLTVAVATGQTPMTTASPTAGTIPVFEGPPGATYDTENSILAQSQITPTNGCPSPCPSGNLLSVGGTISANGTYVNVLAYNDNGTPSSGIKIVTNLPFVNAVEMPTIIIHGYDYSTRQPIGLMLNWYVYGGVFTNYAVTSFGAYTPTIKLATTPTPTGGISCSYQAQAEPCVVIFIQDTTSNFERFTVSAYAHGMSEQPSWFAGWYTQDAPIDSGSVATTLPLQYVNSFGTITAGSGSGTSTSGQVILQGPYSSANNVLATWGTEYSSGAPVMGYGVTPSQTLVGSFNSSVGNLTLPRAALTVGSSGNILFYTAPSQSTSTGSALSPQMTPVMSILNGGNVGIGTTNPNSASLLSVGPTSQFQVNASGSLTAASASLGIPLGVASGGTGVSSLTGLVKGTGTSALISATAGTDYQLPLTVTTNGTSGAATWVNNTLNIPQYSGGGNYTFSSGLANNSGTITNTLATGIAGGQSVVGGTQATDALVLTGTTANGTVSATAIQLNVGYNGATHALTILNSGSVGIGTTSPSSTLHVSSGAKTYNSVSNEFDSDMEVQGTYSSRAVGQGSALGFIVPANTDGSNPWEQGRILVTPDNTNNADASGRIYLQTRYSYSGGWYWNNNLVLTSSGNVGIGTTNPGATLEVNGTAQIDTSLAVGAGGITFTGQSGTQTTPWTGVLCGGDYAEAVDPAGEKASYEPGDVLVIADGADDVRKSAEPYATTVAGIYATKPGVVGPQGLASERWRRSPHGHGGHRAHESLRRERPHSQGRPAGHFVPARLRHERH